jgi:hypothetical protein
MAALPIAAKPALGADHPDAALLALEPEIEAIVRRESELIAAVLAADDAFLAARPTEPIRPESGLSPDVEAMISRDIKEGKITLENLNEALFGYPRHGEARARAPKAA